MNSLRAVWIGGVLLSMTTGAVAGKADRPTDGFWSEATAEQARELSDWMARSLSRSEEAGLTGVWNRGLALYSAIRPGPAWSDVISVCDVAVRQFPFSDMPRIARIAPGAKLVADVVTQEVTQDEIIVPANLIYVRFSHNFLKPFLCKQVDAEHTIRDQVLGAAVSGTCRTIGQTELALLENPRQAQAELRFTGECRFQTVGVADPVQIHSRGTTRFEALTNVKFDGQQVRHSPVTTTASTSTTRTGITTHLGGLRGRIARRVAANEESRSHAQAEAITTERTRQRIAAGFEKRVEAGLAAFTARLQAQYARLPFEGRFALQEIRCATTPERLELVLIGRGESQPHFTQPPDALKNHPDIEVHLHTALIQKAILDPELRAPLQSAVLGMVDRPLLKVVSAARENPDEPGEPERDLQIQWTEGEGLEWLSLAWYDQKPNEKPSDGERAAEPKARVTRAVDR